MQTERTPTEARQADTTGVVRWVLTISMAAAAVLLAVVYVYFASSPGT